MDHPRPKPETRRLFAGLALAALSGAAGAAHAQSASSSASAFSRGYGFSSGELTRGIDVSTRDLNGNKIIVDGVTQIGSDQSVFATSRATGAVDAFAGVGALGTSAGGTAIGNNLQVTVNGNYNTVVVSSQQTNNGAVSATSVLNGKVNIDGN